MEFESKFLDCNYLRTRMNDFDEIRKRKVGYSVYNSNNPASKSVYIEFIVNGQKRGTLRISDHQIDVPFQTQFLVSETAILTKKKKELFVRTVNNCIRHAIAKNLKKTFENLQ